jgi:mannosylglycoprotein endo-beta-mannosidase
MRLHILLWISFLSGAVVGSEISWYLCKASSVASVADIFSKDFNVVTACPTARVPGTILANTATAGQGDLYYDRNLAKIPDIHDVGSDYYTYYYVGKFMNPSAGEAPKVLMTFNGVNYLPLFYVNGVQLHDVRYNGQHTPDSGMFRRHILELSGHLVDGENMVAVLVYPPTHVGDASNGGQGGDHDIARNGAISQYVAGWDWIQATPDRNTGLWDTVDIEVLEINVTVANPAVVTKEIDYDTNVATVVAELQLMNLDTNLEASSGVLEVEIIDAEEKVVLSACEVVPSIQPQEILDFTTSLYEIDNAHLWWPYTHGDPYLYDVSITYYQNTDCKALSARRASDTDSHSKYASAVQLKHGVRLIEGYMDSGTKGHAFKVNGQRVFIVGGNWIATDQLLRYTDSHSRYHTEVALHRDMGFNLIRVWGGGLAERNAFYAACDSLGVLVHQEFWMTGDNNGRWAGNYSWPDDHTSYLINAQDTILRLRKHTSLLLYCGGNELNPRGLNPNPEIARGLATLLGTYDSSRYYIESSMAPAEPNMSLYDPTYALAPADGPYNVLLPEQWYNERNPGLANYSKIAISFQPEVGSVSTPVLRSLKRFLPPESLTPEALPSKGDVSVDTTWNYHKYITYTTPIAHPIKAIDSNNPGSQDAYGTSEDDDAKKKEVSPSSPSAAQARQATTAKTHDNEVTIYDHIYSFSPPGDGSPIDVEEYAMRAQMVQYEQFRALFEGYLLHQWEHYAAVLFWKSQSPWPALRGGLYDYYLDYTGKTTICTIAPLLCTVYACIHRMLLNFS